MEEIARLVPVLGKRNPRLAVWLVALIAIAAPIVANLAFGRSWVRILDFALLYMLLAIGLNLVVGYAGLLDLGYIAFYAVGAYTWAFLASPHFGVHLPFWMVLPIGAACAALAGIILGFPVLRLRGDYLAIVTLGFGEIIRIFLNNLNHPVNITNGPQGIGSLDSIHFCAGDPLAAAGEGVLDALCEWQFGSGLRMGGFKIHSLFLFYYLFLLCVVGAIVFMHRLQVSRIGRAWAAMRDDELAAKAIGINTRNMKLLAFALGATFGGVSGGLFGSFQGFVSPESFSLMESIAVLVMVVFGGMGNIAGALVGALILSLLPELLREVAVPLQQALFGTVLLDPEVLRMLLYSLAMILMMLLRPRGLIPARARYARAEHVREANA